MGYIPFNYRPISNLSLHSKILERVISSQLITYLTTNKIPNIFQSTYLPHKSTESALTLITSDLLSGLNNNRVTILVLLDMSSAFDTLDHNFLIHRLSAIGITGIALNWFTSYITNRSSSVTINTHSSPSRSITHGVPQSSVLGPLLFNIYLLPCLTYSLTTPTSPSILMPTTFNYILTGQTPLLIPWQTLLLYNVHTQLAYLQLSKT